MQHKPYNALSEKVRGPPLLKSATRGSERRVRWCASMAAHRDNVELIASDSVGAVVKVTKYTQEPFLPGGEAGTIGNVGPIGAAPESSPISSLPPCSLKRVLPPCPAFAAPCPLMPRPCPEFPLPCPLLVDQHKGHMSRAATSKALQQQAGTPATACSLPAHTEHGRQDLPRIHRALC